MRMARFALYLFIAFAALCGSAGLTNPTPPKERAAVLAPGEGAPIPWCPPSHPDCLDDGS